jgi:hypothetical protein
VKLVRLASLIIELREDVSLSFFILSWTLSQVSPRYSAAFSSHVVILFGTLIESFV